MSDCLDTLLADCRGAEVALDSEAAHCVLLTDEQMAAVDETAGIVPPQCMRNVLIRAAFVARERRFDSCFGELA